MMNGDIDWTALDYVCEIYGIEDPETMIHDLMAIREQKRPKQNG